MSERQEQKEIKQDRKRKRFGQRGPLEARNRPKDFKKTWGKLLRYNRKYMPFVILSVVLAMAGSICALIGPDRIKEMTNSIQEGILTDVNTERVKAVALSMWIPLARASTRALCLW